VDIHRGGDLGHGLACRALLRDTRGSCSAPLTHLVAVAFDLLPSKAISLNKWQF
jgi:hypothetical protein